MDIDIYDPQHCEDWGPSEVVELLVVAVPLLVRQIMSCVV